MITPMLRTALEKQGYKLIGTHSGVKLCRWTKVRTDARACPIPAQTCDLPFTAIALFRSQSMLRGRGGCYKHTFYGIESHRCMETTPSLACANKCVFCWRCVGLMTIAVRHCKIFRRCFFQFFLTAGITRTLWERRGGGKWTTLNRYSTVLWTTT